MSAGWHFAKHLPGLPVVDALSSEHFADEDEDWRPGEVLVRECIQNSLDARYGSESVSVVFRVQPAGAMPADTAEFWLSDLWPHFQSRDCASETLRGIGPRPAAGNFVVVEDFGTHGLEGDVRQGGLSDQDNRFFNFFRAEGLSGNPSDGTSGGSWGVGKSVFNRCSQIHTFLALTGRRAEADVALIGKCLLWQHRTPEGEYQGIGQFGTIDPHNEHLVLPVGAGEAMGRFAGDFGIARPIDGSGAEPGLSVVIPYADPRITAEGILEIVIREYFHPILAGRLTVRVSGLIGGRNSSVTLDRDSLIVEAGRHVKREVIQLLGLAEWSLSADPKPAFVLPGPSAGSPPAWGVDSIPSAEPPFEELSRLFEQGQPISIRVPVRVSRADYPEESAGFTVHLQRDLVGPGYRPVFVRGCIVVPNARQQPVRNHHLFCLIHIDEGPLAVMLRAAEPPAHTFWSPETRNIRRRRYAHARQLISFVVGAPRILAEALSSSRLERDVDVWTDFFPSPSTEGERIDRGKFKKGKRVSPPPPPPPQSRPKPFRIAEIPGGFAVVRDNSSNTPLPSSLEVLTAYDTSRGDAFKQYDPADFRIQALARVATDVEDPTYVDNRIVFRPASDGFRVEVTGFDLNRDLIVRVSSRDDAVGAVHE